MPRVARPSEATAFARSAYITDVIFFMLCAIPTVANSSLVKILPPQQSLLLVPSAGSPFGGLCTVSSRGRGRSSVQGTMKGIRPGADEECTFGGLCRISSRGQIQDDRPGADVIDLHEIHLAPQSSLQVPVGHIPVPGGIKLCSPGTFLVANYLIINNGSFQVNFTKPNSATIQYTNSQ